MGECALPGGREAGRVVREGLNEGHWIHRISSGKAASVNECVRSCRYAASQECHLMRTGFSRAGLFVVKKRRLPENRPPIADLWPADRRLRGITV
jgi:hypothetical protein